MQCPVQMEIICTGPFYKKVLTNKTNIRIISISDILSDIERSVIKCVLIVKK